MLNGFTLAATDSSQYTPWIWLAVLLAIILLLRAIASVLSPRKRERVIDCEPAGPLLTAAEAKLATVLASAFDEYHLCVKVRLGDLVKPAQPDAGLRSSINQKHLDYVLVDPATWEPVVAIELDDWSHESERARRNDQVKNEALRTAGIPLVRLRKNGEWTRNAVRKAVEAGAG